MQHQEQRLRRACTSGTRNSGPRISSDHPKVTNARQPHYHLHTPLVRCCCVRVFVLCVRVCDYGCAGSCTVVMGRTTASKLKQTCCYRLGRDVWEMSQGVWIAASPMRLETLALCALNSTSPVAWKCIIYSLPVCLPCLRSHVLVPVATVVLCTSVLGGRYRVLRPSISKRCPGPDRPVQRCGRGM